VAIRVSVEPLPLVRREAQSLRQALAVTVSLIPGGPYEPIGVCVARITGCGEPIASDLGPLTPGDHRHVLFIPYLDSTRTIQVVVICGSLTARCEVLLRPVRKWTITLALHSHTDLGFTHPISEVVRIHNENTDRAIELCRETAAWPDGERFAWTCEVTWQVQNYLRDRSPEQREALMQLARQRRIEIGGLYAGEHTDLLGHEEAVRSLYLAAELRRHYHVPIETVLLSDVPGCTWGFVQVMAKSGIKNLLLADNNFVAPFLARTDLPRPFLWQGADDTSVLAWFTDHPYYAYVEGELYGFNDSTHVVEAQLVPKLAALEQAGYPYSSLLVQYAFDNARLSEKPMHIVREWNRLWEWPKIRLGTPGEFFQALRTEGRDAIPVRRGDWTNWWSSIVTGFPVEAALSRKLHDELPAMESLLALLHMHHILPEYPRQLLNSCYDRLLAFDEHSGGGGLWKPPNREEQQRALREGYDFIHTAFHDVEEWRQKAVDLGLAHGLLKASSPATVQLEQEGADAVECVRENGSLLLENRHYRLQVDRKDKRLVSVFDKDLHREVIGHTRRDWGCPMMYRVTPAKQIEMGKYIPEIYTGVAAPGELTNLSDLGDISLESAGGCGNAPACIFRYSVGGVEWLTRSITLSNDDRSIIIGHTFKRSALNEPSLQKAFARLYSPNAMLYVVFDFVCEQPAICYESPNMVIDPCHDPMRGTCRDFFAIQHWIMLSDTRMQIVVAPEDTSIVDVGSPGFQTYKTDVDQPRSTLFFRVGSLDEWGTERGSPYTRDDDLSCRFRITTFAPSTTSAGSLEAAMTFGWKPREASIRGNERTGGDRDVASVCPDAFEGIPSHVRVLTFKRAEDGACFILRMQEMIGQAAYANVSIKGADILAADRAMLTEEPGETLRVVDNAVAVKFLPFSIVTLRLTLHSRRQGSTSS
jgi:hypothetical protein